ncbi:MAG: 3,4-dihydroxy-2-butanone 4-phosphate synthase [Methanonatronarchaeales archaeon]|nr:3,4-dihydroxy-2-butanone 4-phosphate synthase [Methanonatronarchaeales archaeon]
MLLRAVEDLREGRPVLLFDAADREGETDMVIPAEAATYEDVRLMREAAGGLICVAIHPDSAESLGLPFARDLLDGFEEHVTYDGATSFSVWVNHRDTFTGITDRDRALTARKVAESVRDASNGGAGEFRSEFSVPGHVPLLIGAKGLLDARQGQTELSLELARMASITPAMVLCEMLDGETGNALSEEGAREFAERSGISFVEGSQVTNRSVA